jgi:hypothetical protein
VLADAKRDGETIHTGSLMTLRHEQHAELFRSEKENSRTTASSLEAMKFEMKEGTFRYLPSKAPLQVISKQPK